MSKLNAKDTNAKDTHLSHSCIWACPVYAVKQLFDKLDSKLELCYFVGYPKGTRGYYFYSKFDMKIFVSKNAKFMEEEYIMNHTIRDMNEWAKNIESRSIQDNVVPINP